MTRLSQAVASLWLLLATAGCARNSGNQNAFLFPWQERPERIPGVKTPQERIGELKDIAVNRQPEAKTPAQSDVLAREIQNEQDPLVRLHIVRALATFPNDPKASAVLHAGLEDPEESVRIACCEAWGRRGGPEAVEELTTVLEAESNIDVRMAAAKALGETKHAAAIQPLANVLADNDPALQRRAIESLKGVSGKDYGYDVQAWRQYAAGEPVQAKPVSFAERFRKWF